MMGNPLAYSVLLAWPLLTVYLYNTKQVGLATILTVLAGLLFLPVRTEIDLPLIPAFSKDTAPLYSAIFASFFIARKRLRIFSGDFVTNILFLTLLIIPFFTYANNTEALRFGDTQLPGLSLHDGFSMMFNQGVIVFAFFLGKRFLGDKDNQILLFKVIVVSALMYTLIVLFEIRFSPQLHTWIYGYFPHEQFIQQMRAGGFRSVGFIGHGLEVGFFMATALICAATLWKNKIIIKAKLAIFFSNLRADRKSVNKGFGGLYTVSYMAIILLLQKATAALLYGVLGTLSILFLSPRKIMWVALLISTFAISYPVLKIMEWVPEEKILTYAASYDVQRAQSLATRFYNENQLIERASIKPYFGWGQWGRARVYNHLGDDISITDGAWIIQFGVHGVFGFLAMFGLIFWTVVRAFKGYRYCENESEQRFLAAHMFLVALIMFDQLPNFTLSPWYWLVVGALAARTNNLLDRAKKN
jgi:hypothetical protein